MANLVFAKRPSTSTLSPTPNLQKTCDASVDMPVGTAVCIDANGKFAPADGTNADINAEWWGLLTRDVKAGSSVTARHGCEFGCVFNPPLAVGTKIYVGAAGGLVSTALTNSGPPIAKVYDAGNIYVFHPAK